MNRMFWVRAIALSCLSSSFSQQPTPMAPDASGVPRLVSFEDMLRDPSGKPHAGIAGITFAIYKDQHEGAPLWLETQNVQADVKGNHTVRLGATNPAGASPSTWSCFYAAELLWKQF